MWNHAITVQVVGGLLFAQQMIEPANPFTSRVIVNRLWHHLTGRGIVASVDNFGVLGQKPSHPELLDYLAVELMEDDWSLKRMIKRIMLSSTYRMSSRPNEDAETVDPNNELLHRMNIRRMQGEVIRDTVLSLSGRLGPTTVWSASARLLDSVHARSGTATQRAT